MTDSTSRSPYYTGYRPVFQNIQFTVDDIPWRIVIDLLRRSCCWYFGGGGWIRTTEGYNVESACIYGTGAFARLDYPAKTLKLTNVEANYHHRIAYIKDLLPLILTFY